MERRTATFSQNKFIRKFRYFKSELDLFLTYSDWNITCACVLSFITDFIAIFLISLEPLSVVCLDYVEAFTLFSLLTFYQFIMITVFGVIVLLVTNPGRFRSQIVILFFHAFGVFLLSYIFSSMTSCFADVNLPRPLHYEKFYELHPNDKRYVGPKECFSEMNNCHRGYFSHLMTVLTISIIVGCCHTVFYGTRAWRRLAIRSRAPATPSARPLMRSDFDDEYLPVSLDDSYQADESSLTSDAPARPPKGRCKSVLDPRRKLTRQASSVVSTSGSSQG